MEKMIRYLFMIISVLILNTGFSQDSTELNIAKDFYNTRNVKTIFDLGSYEIKVKNDVLIFNEIHGNISSPIQYSNLYAEFNFNNIYQITDSSSNTYYFRFGWVSFDENETVFSNVKWIDNNGPTKFDQFYTYNFSVVSMDYIQFGNRSLCTIGDSQTWWSDAQNLRKAINENNPNLIFLGSNTDIYGYGHEGEGGNSTGALLKRINNIPIADYYTLLIGTNDWKNDLEISLSNILKITDYLAALNPNGTILYLTPIPTTNEKRDLFNRRLSERLLLNYKENERIIILDLGEEMRANKNWKTDYLQSDGLHQNAEGVQLMGKLIGEKIQTMPIN